MLKMQGFVQETLNALILLNCFDSTASAFHYNLHVEDE